MNLNKIVWASHDDDITHPRRDFLRKTLLLTALPLGAALPFAGLRAATLAGPSMSGACGLKATGAATYVPPARARGSAVRNVRDYGAVGNGSTDDTNAFQRAIDSLPSTGGTVVVPAGNYKIDGARSVKLRSRMHLKMDPDARLVAKATSAGEYRVLIADKLDDIEISGGQIIGERDSHQGTTGEGGHGICVRGCDRVTIRDIRVSKCWGDGINIGPRPAYKAPLIMSRNVAIVGVTCLSNRRNALAITNAVNVDVWDSEFSDTHGTKPEAGIDVEPNEDRHGSNGYCDNVHIENCIMSNNAECGIVIWRRAKGVSLRGCVMHNNTCSGLFTESAENVQFIGNTVSRSGQNGAAIRKYSKNFEVYNNTFYENYTNISILQRTPFYLTGTAKKVERDILVSSTGTTVTVGKNYYR